MKSQKNENFDGQKPFEVFYDGQCPLCRREIEMLRTKDFLGKIRFTDFATEDFQCDDSDLNYETLMKRIHGRGSNGDIVTGPEVFRQIYGRLGFRKMVFLSRIAPISWIAEVAYCCFAKVRPLLNRNRRRESSAGCDTGDCYVNIWRDLN